MKKIISIIILVLFGFAANAQTEVMQWAKQLKGLGNETGWDITTDSAGNVYATGQFSGIADLDPGPATLNVNALGYQDIYFEKLNANGDLIWVKTIGGNGNERPYNIRVDKAGNIYVMGAFDSTMDVDPGVAVYNMTPVGSADFFICKLDMTGNFVWAKQIGDIGNAGNGSLILDEDGYIYYSGIFYGTVDFDPGPGINNITSAGAGDIFISKMDFGGNFIWAKSIGGTCGDDIRGIALDEMKNIYHTGQFCGSVDFDPGIDTTFLTAGFLQTDIYLSKLDSNGNFIWAKHLKGNSNSNQYMVGIEVSTASELYINGWFSDTLDMDPGPNVYNIISPIVANVMTNDSFVGKYDSAGNFNWVRQYSGTSHTYMECIVLDTLGNVYLGGGYFDTTDFDPGPGQYNLATNNYKDLFFTKLDTAGIFQWAISMGGTGSDHCFGINTDNVGNVFTTGAFYSTVDFDPGAGVFNLVATGNNWDAYIHKLAQCDININTTLNNNIISAVATGSNYQWIDCNDSNAIIPGATAQSFAPASNGMYAVIVSVGNCRDTSQCIAISEIGVGVQEWSKGAECRIFPNPSNGAFTLVLNNDAEVTITNILGETVHRGALSAGKHQLNLDEVADGLYFVNIKSAENDQLLKLVISR